MKRILYKVALAVGAPLLGACAATSPAGPTTATAPADTTRRPAPAAIPAEDVRKYRPAAATTPPRTTAAPIAPVAKVPYVAPTNHVNAPLEQRLRDQAYTNQNVKYTQGYRILAYVGLERDKAMAIRRNVISRYPDETDYITFKQPIYRLYIGDYVSKLEAARGMQRVRPLVPKAELEATQVLLNKLP
jgi:hypothetical protein